MNWDSPEGCFVATFLLVVGAASAVFGGVTLLHALKIWP